MDPIIKIFDSLLRDELRGKMDKTKMQYLGWFRFVVIRIAKKLGKTSNLKN